jgi:integrase
MTYSQPSSFRKMCYNGRSRKQPHGARDRGTASRDERTSGDWDDTTLARNTERVYWRGKRECYYVLYSFPQRSARGRIVGYVEKRISTGITDKTAYDEAVAWAREHRAEVEAQLLTNQSTDCVAPSSARSLTLDKYSHNFFTVTHQAQLNALAEHGEVSETLDNKAAMLRLHILPHLGRFFLTEITRADVKDWISRLHTQPQPPRGRKLSKNYCIQIRSTLREILERAVDETVLTSNPAAGRVKLYDDKRPRGILTRGEIRDLLDERNIATIWRGNIILYTAAVLAITLGMRLGEILGLQLEHVHLDDPQGPTIDIRHQWSRRLRRLKSPKKDSIGDDIAICDLAARRLSILIKERKVTGQEDLVFGRDEDMRVPISYWRFERHFGYAMDRLEINHGERNIVLHSGRHGFATIGKEEVGEEETRAATRHKSASSWKVYSSHKTREGTRKVARAFDAILASAEERNERIS